MEKVAGPLYFLALVPPAPLSAVLLKWKNYLAENFHSSAALRSPPHLTLQMPFRLPLKREVELATALSDFIRQLNPRPFIIRLNGFGTFGRSVIFIRVLESEPLVNLQKEVERFCETALSVLPESGKRPYHQHVTLAFRDLSKNEFRKAWDALKDESLSNSFVADRIILLRHNDREWVTKYEFLFGETNTNYPYDPATEASL